MTVTVSTTQKSVLKFDESSTVLDLIQALTENLGGEWDNAKLSLDNFAHGATGVWRLVVTLEDGEEPNRPERWMTVDGEHVATVAGVVDGDYVRRTCSCGDATNLTEAEMDQHLRSSTPR